MIGRFAAVLSLGVFLTPAFAGPKPPRAAKVQPAPKAQAAPPQAQVNRPQAADNHPGEQQVDRLMQMTPAEREKALSRLAPGRRQNIERRIGELQKLPPAQQSMVRNRLEMLNSLPPQRANQVRRSLQQFKTLPEERSGQMRQEMQRMATLPDDDRRAHMNSEEFRNRYTATEQQMMGNIMEVTPQP